MKLKIPVDLVTINCNMVEEGVKALEYSTKYIEFNNVFLLSDQTISGNFDLISIKKIRDVEDYNNEILNLSKHIKSEYVLIIQHDGHVINHKKWDDLFLKFDYIGAPWPNSKKWNERWKYYPKEMEEKILKNLNLNRIGNGGFSLRSKKFLDYSRSYKEVDGAPEDIFLNILNYDRAFEYGIKYPDVKTAISFSYEIPLKGKNLEKEKRFHFYNKNNHFGWHGNKFINSNKLLNLKNN
tara:strand:- start:892 stop:1605 length:714 start_codon:yes stop_codon:yes gene_type:complete